jgi:ribosomal protein L11 methyltransferase
VKAKRLRVTFKKQPIPQVRFSERRLAYRDWAEKWKEDYQIQNLGKLFVIVPVWRKREYQPNQFDRRIPIWMEPLSAFGSGEHETTRLVVRLIETIKSQFVSFLDVGTGTGILSIAAAYCGARQIVGFDHDKPSVDCAKFNFHKNISNEIAAQFIGAELARFKSKVKFDLVGANINSHILENYRKQIVGAARKGGWVLVSGILNQTYASFREAFDGKDLRCLKVLRGRRWVAILYKKREG